jgi:gliding motility-associated-like protein
MQTVTVSAPVPGCSATDTIWLHIVPDDFAILSPDMGICAPPGTYQISVIGDTEFAYSWSPTGGVSNAYIKEPMISPPYTFDSFTFTLTAMYPKNTNCPEIKHTITYRMYDPQVNILTNDTIICIGLPMPVGVDVTPEKDKFNYTWTGPIVNFLEGGDSLQPHFFTQTPGQYKYYIDISSADVPTCVDRDSITIEVAPPVQIVIQPGNTVIPYGSSIQLDAIRLSPDHLFYTWIPNDGSLNNPNVSNPIATPKDSTTYTVIGMNEWGCRDKAEVTIDVELDMTEYIPSAFTPNGDGLNDLFRIRGIKYQKIVDFKVYNRWGEIVYDFKTGDSQGWNGKFKGQDAEMGVYNYSIILAKPGRLDKIYKGNVTLIR